MDARLAYAPTLRGYDLQLAGGDLVSESTLTTAVLLSLLSDRLADADDALINPGERRGWWADAFPSSPDTAGDLFGSRLWLLARSKQTVATMVRCERYCQEALAWLVADGLAREVTVGIGAPRRGWLIAAIDIDLVDGGPRRLRFAWDDATQAWTLSGELS